MNPNRYVIERNRTPERIDKFFKVSIQYLIVLNIVLGLFTVFNLYLYPKYIHEDTPTTSKRISELYPNEI